MMVLQQPVQTFLVDQSRNFRDRIVLHVSRLIIRDWKNNEELNIFFTLGRGSKGLRDADRSHELHQHPEVQTRINRDKNLIIICE